MEALFKQYVGEKPKNPPVEEVKTEIEKELQAAFKKKETEALELYEKGNAAYDNNQFKEAISFLTAAVEIVETASFHFARGNSYLVTSDFKLALQDYEVALGHYKSSENRQGEESILGKLGITYSSLGQYDKAIDYYTQALAIAREIGDRNGEGSHLGNLGLAYRSLGQYDKAIEYKTLALAIFEKIKSPNAERARQKISELKAQKDL